MESGARNGFPRSARLLDGKAYAFVFKQNSRLSNEHWTLLAAGHRGSSARLGLAIAKKRAKRAVDRNRLKRIARESFRHQRMALAGFDVVLLNRDAAASASGSAVRRSLDQLWLKLRRRRQQGVV